uniref:Uncharacterized protein n=1 Tax=Panagrolaimus davidi TaxID=227884 RepID=A0A914R4A8_9BILA
MDDEMMDYTSYEMIYSGERASFEEEGLPTLQDEPQRANLNSISGPASNLLHPDFVALAAAPSIDHSLEENSFEDDDHSIGDSSAS